MHRGEIVGRGYGSAAVPDKEAGRGGPIGRAVVGREQGERKRFVFKWGLEVGEIDCVCTPQRGGAEGEVSETETGQGKEKQFIFMLL